MYTHKCAYLLVLFATLEGGDGVLVGVTGDVDTLGDLGRRRRGFEDAFVLLRVRRSSRWLRRLRNVEGEISWPVEGDDEKGNVRVGVLRESPAGGT